MTNITSSNTTCLYVRMEGFSPFALVINGEVSASALERAARHSAQERFGASCEAAHVLVRRIVFTGRDQLMDFARLRRSSASRDAPPAAAAALSPNFAFVDMCPVHARSGTAAAVRESYRARPSGGASAASHLSFAAFDRLALLMTDPRGPHRELVARVVLLTYRQLAAPAELLERLIERHAGPPPDAARCRRADRLAAAELRRDVQRAVFAVLEEWVAAYGGDFAGDDALCGRLREWAQTAIDREGAPAEVLRRLARMERAARLARDPPAQGKSSPAKLGQGKPHEIAAQLTILTADAHRQLAGPELLEGRWLTEEAPSVSSLAHYRDFLARVKNLVSYTVVSEQDAERRAQNMGLFLSVCDELIKLRNWDMVVAVYNGLKEPAVKRLLRRWTAIPSDAAGILSRLHKLLDVDDGYSTLKALMRKECEPQFPCITSFFPELREIENTKISQEGLVNFDRLLQQYRLVQFLLTGRNVSVDHLVPNDELLGIFSSWRSVDEPELMKLSRKVEKN